ncbi:MAG: NUMOD3 domain-containing DNA-binding protein [Methylococcales bacterium]|nr:NUMOD3 domain-containing DNA-binding protein [Methylococcales bacterium]
MTKQFYVYTHAKPDGSIFYVGKGLKRRTDSISRDNNHHKNIVKKYGKENIIVKTMLCRSEQHALDLEVRMIAALRNGGVKLVNLTDGGEGTCGYIPAPRSIEYRAKLSAAHKGKSLSTETRAKIGKAGIGRIVTVETRAKISAIHTGMVRTPEQKAKMSAWQIGRVLSAEHRAKISAANKNRSPETLAKMAAASKGKKHSPDTKTKCSVAAKLYFQNPEARAKQSAATKLWWAERKAKAAFRGQLSLF